MTQTTRVLGVFTSKNLGLGPKMGEIDEIPTQIRVNLL